MFCKLAYEHLIFERRRQVKHFFNWLRLNVMLCSKRPSIYSHKKDLTTMSGFFKINVI